MVSLWGSKAEAWRPEPFVVAVKDEPVIGS